IMLNCNALQTTAQVAPRPEIPLRPRANPSELFMFRFIYSYIRKRFEDLARPMKKNAQICKTQAEPGWSSLSGALGHLNLSPIGRGHDSLLPQMRVLLHSAPATRDLQVVDAITGFFSARYCSRDPIEGGRSCRTRWVAN